MYLIILAENSKQQAGNRGNKMSEKSGGWRAEKNEQNPVIAFRRSVSVRDCVCALT